MIFLRNNDLFQIVGLLESVSAAKLEEQDRAILDQFPGAKIRGAYGHLSDGQLLAIIRVENNLYLRINEIAVNWGEIVEITLNDLTNNKRHLTVVTLTKRFDVIYDRPIIDPPISPIMEPFSEEENFDFGLFVKHFADDPARRGRAFNSES